MELSISVVGGKKYQIVENAFLEAFFDMLFVVECCLKSRAAEEHSILVYDFCWKRLLK